MTESLMNLGSRAILQTARLQRCPSVGIGSGNCRRAFWPATTLRPFTHHRGRSACFGHQRRYFKRRNSNFTAGVSPPPPPLSPPGPPPPRHFSPLPPHTHTSPFSPRDFPTNFPKQPP